MGRSIGVVSLKGGVGKTSVVAALGAAIANFDKKVLLVDGNLSAPNLGFHFKIIDPERSLHDVLNREYHAKDVVHSVHNLDVIPASAFSRKNVSPLKLKDRLNYLKKKYDFIIYDSSPSLNEETLGVMLASDGLLVVTTPDHATLGTTIKAVKLAKQRGAQIDGLVLNKVHNKKFEVSLDDIENTLDVPVLAVVPHDVNVLKALSEFTPSTLHKPKSSASEEYRRLASTLVGQKDKPLKLKRFFRWMNPKKQDINRAVFYESLFE